MKKNLIKKHESGSEVKSKQIKDQNVRPVPILITKPRDKKKNMGIPKMIGV